MYTAGDMEEDHMTDETDELFARIKAIGDEDVAVVEWPRRERARWRARVEDEDTARYGETPRSTWPTKVKGADLRERDYWITKLYRDQNLTGSEVAAKLGLHISTVQKEVVRLGIQRGQGNYGHGGVKERRVEMRRRLVRQLHENGASLSEIAEEVGYHETTIRYDLRAMGLPYRPKGVVVSPDKSRQLIEDATRTFANIAEVVLGQSLNVKGATAEDFREWERRLAQTGTAMRKIRKAMKQEEDQCP